MTSDVRLSTCLPNMQPPLQPGTAAAPHVLLFEGSDFETFPTGGQLTMAKALIRLFGNRLALVGFSGPEGPVGRWVFKNIEGTNYSFFPVARRFPSGRKPLIPARLTFYLGLKRYRARIMSLGCGSAFTQAPEALMAVAQWNWSSICFWFPGVESTLKGSRYFFAKPLHRLFDNRMYEALDRAEVILAAADERAIGALAIRSEGRIAREKITPLTTFVDTSVYRPLSRADARMHLGISPEATVFVNHGRIGRLKGWELLLDAFELFLRSRPNALLYFVGDGEDRPSLQAAIAKRNLQSSVTITGFQKPAQIVQYLNAANAILFASFIEGWSAAMLEGLACGRPLVSTQVSGATSMIITGENGFVVNSRDPIEFSEAMSAALQLPDAEHVSASIARKYDLSAFGERLADAWAPFRVLLQGSGE